VLRFSTVQMFNIFEQMQKPKAPVVPMAVRNVACIFRYHGGNGELNSSAGAD